ncbi:MULTISPECIES: virulence factor SrfC family protein [Weeksellaceae]|uniref:virulence factor SrfC family protein n=3 Tax=Flavobacteriales TaxID=200644 RepID=UPI0025C00A83|nr:MULTISPECIES: virulence factor SrfC family protein [unclassified Empedobacter]
MKNYSDQFINTIKLGIENNVSILDQLINWGNENLRYEEKDQFLLKIKNSKNVFHRIYENIESKPVMAVFGGSQVGKSYLIKNLLSSEGEPFLIKNNEIDYDFLKDINPPGVGAESTGVVTRFTIDQNLKFPDFPIQIKLLSAKDILIIVLDSFFLDLKKIKKYVALSDLNEHLEKLEQNISDNQQDYLTDFDVLEIKEYFENHLSKHTILFESLRESKFFERVGMIIKNYSQNQWLSIFSILWLKNDNLNQLYSLLIDSLVKFNFSKNAFIKFNEVLRGGGEILDVQRLKEIYTSSVITQVKTEDGQVVQILQSLITALTSELIFTVPKELVDEKPFLKQSDLLDFPGARSRLAIELEDIDNQIIPDMLLRGKVSYLFNKYSDNYSINNLLFCTNDKQLDVNEIPALLFNWIKNNIGENKIERSNALQNTEVPPLFVIFTFFNNQLKFDITNDLHYKEDSDSLNYKWDTRFNRFFKNEIVTQTKDWDTEWTLMNHHFQNFYLLRDYKYSSDTFDGFEIEGRETNLKPERVDYLNALKSSFENFEFVNKHFKNPTDVWEDSTSLNSDGSLRIINNLNLVSNNHTKTNYYLNKLNELITDIKSFLESLVHSDDVSVIRANRMKDTNTFQFSFNNILTKDTNAFNSFLKIIGTDTVENFNLLNENIVVDSSQVSNNSFDQSNILFLQYPELKNAKSYQEAIEILKSSLWLGTSEEVEDFLHHQNIDKTKLFEQKVSKSKPEIYTELIFENWKSKIMNFSNYQYFTNNGLSQSSIVFLADHLFSIVKNRNIESKLTKVLNDIVSETESNRGIEEFLAETFSTIINDITINFDLDFFSKDEISEINKMPNYRQFINYQKFNLEPNNDLSDLFEESAILNSEAIMLEKYNKWIEFLRISLLVNCGFVNYDEQANLQLKSYIQNLTNFNLQLEYE